MDELTTRRPFSVSSLQWSEDWSSAKGNGDLPWAAPVKCWQESSDRDSEEGEEASGPARVPAGTHRTNVLRIQSQYSPAMYSMTIKGLDNQNSLHNLWRENYIHFCGFQNWKKSCIYIPRNVILIRLCKYAWCTCSTGIEVLDCWVRALFMLRHCTEPVSRTTPGHFDLVYSLYCTLPSVNLRVCLYCVVQVSMAHNLPLPHLFEAYLQSTLY